MLVVGKKHENNYKNWKWDIKEVNSYKYLGSDVKWGYKTFKTCRNKSSTEWENCNANSGWH